MASASSMPSPDEKQCLNSLLECSICLETFDDPRTLLCLHSFCKKCLENFVHRKREDELNCPVCRTKFTLDEGGVAGMTRNHFICNMVEELSIKRQDKCIPCSHCEQASVGRCVTCEQFMCEKCFKPHNEYPGFKDHIVLTMEELSKPENQSKIKNISKCNQHPKKKLKYYCETCDELICRHCMEFDHDKQHKFSPLEKAAKSKRDGLKQNCEVLQGTIDDNNRKTQVLKGNFESLNNNFYEAQRVITEQRDQLLAKVNAKIRKKANSILEDARQNYDRKTRNIREEIHEKETFGSRIKGSADMARNLLENGNDEEIVSSYKSVEENVKDAKGKVLDAPDEDVDVLSLDADKIYQMLVTEIKDLVENKGEIEIIPGSNQGNISPKTPQKVWDDASPKSGKKKPVQIGQQPPKISRETKPSEESGAANKGRDGINNENRMPLMDTTPHAGTTQQRQRYPSRNTRPSGHFISQDQQYSNFMQKRYQGSATGQSHGQGRIPDQSNAAQHTRQTPKKDRSGIIDVGKMNGKGYFGGGGFFGRERFFGPPDFKH